MYYVLKIKKYKTLILVEDLIPAKLACDRSKKFYRCFSMNYLEKKKIYKFVHYVQHQPQVRSNLVLFFLAKSLGLISIPRGLCVSGHVIWESFASDKSPKCTLNALDEKAWEDAAQRGREWGNRGLFTGRNAQHMTFSSNVQNEHFCYPQRHI